MLLKEKCHYVATCDKRLTHCKFKHFTDCRHLPHRKMVETIVGQIENDVVDYVFAKYFSGLFEGCPNLPDGEDQ